MFLEEIEPEKAKKCALFLHTTPVDQHGTDLPVVAKTLAPEANIVFSGGKVPDKDLVMMYNSYRAFNGELQNQIKNWCNGNSKYSLLDQYK